ncbi:short chain dehydrogenase reductase [Tothia fuscella]|uniref:Short chain dehydrogenase reductase n=1 Tax=Tothia fuscella TaxID=1048955 RepID=A0A9P4P2V2_9PEZI|nr:short chain dehydrogenase reductase [Tothia fuscella]
MFIKTQRNDTYPGISPNLQDLTGRTVVISGASRGIGRSIAVSFTQARASGIVIAARSDLSETKEAILAAASEAKIPAPKILSLTLDVTSQESVEASAIAFSKEFPNGLDILVNSAGNLEPVVKIHESIPKEWWKSYEINVKGVYLMCRSYIPFLLSKPQGLNTICNLTSIGAHLPIPAMSSYCSGKLAVCRITEILQAEYESQGMIAFSIHPGGVVTEMSLSLPQDFHQLLVDTPQLAADSVIWLTGKRREFLKGIYVDSNWDLLELAKRGDEVVEKGLLKCRLFEG